ncbi:RimJ/RimL family protein N-acetyltransferase [Luteibacter rhizovicinus]|uniref:RimJ/RimL family protein N-acetyltransferase n=1 Tax=Luteibacter rhizovicinus TaxID=242606 RepID=A0A4R3YM38_9GAMM|nr:GNAT family protein [Luteibacter rhizovicinus]TCV93262.1 RimJ/RimL family protein N-acetyltransferase [Luteibacter rhizovicinus]
MENKRAAMETERLILDPLRPDDAANLFAYRGDPEVARYQGWKPANESEAAAFIAEQARRPFGEPDSWCQLAIRSRQTGELIGDFGVHFPAGKDDPIEFGLSLKPAEQGRGYAREVMHAGIDLAFRQWGYRRVVGSVDPRNTASVALCRSLGFRQEAHHVESYFFRGEWVDDMIFALLAREWMAVRG